MSGHEAFECFEDEDEAGSLECEQKISKTLFNLFNGLSLFIFQMSSQGLGPAATSLSTTGEISAHVVSGCIFV